MHKQTKEPKWYLHHIYIPIIEEFYQFTLKWLFQFSRNKSCSFSCRIFVHSSLKLLNNVVMLYKYDVIKCTYWPRWYHCMVSFPCDLCSSDYSYYHPLQTELEADIGMTLSVRPFLHFVLHTFEVSTQFLVNCVSDWPQTWWLYALWDSPGNFWSHFTKFPTLIFPELGLTLYWGMPQLKSCDAYYMYSYISIDISLKLYYI